MSRERRVSPTGDVTRLTVLALLAADEGHEPGSRQPMHGYELRRKLHERGLERWADIAFGSIYAALRRLASAQLVDEVGISKEGNRPERTVYRITEDGLEELRRLLREAWSRPRSVAESIDVALCFNGFLPSGEIVRLLDERLAALAESDAAMQITGSEPVAPGGGTRELMKDLVEHRRLLLAAEREWTARVRDAIRSGAYAEQPDHQGDALPRPVAG